MKKIAIICLSLFFALVVQNSISQTAMNMEVVEMEICTAVQDRVPVGSDTVFLKTVEQLYCYTKISGGSEQSKIWHIWYYNDQEMARVELNVRADVWRTWSSKKIAEEWVGDWRVDVINETGDVLKSKAFKIK